MDEATKRFFKMHGNQNLDLFVHGYIYGRYFNEYVYRMGKALNLVEVEPAGEMKAPPEMEPIIDVFVGKTARESLSYDTSTYHGKVVKLDQAQALVSVEEDVALRGLEHIIPYKVANEIVLEDPDHIGVIACPCRLTMKNPCQPLDVCIAVGEPFVGLLEHFGVGGFRRIDAEEARRILKEEHERGHVQAAYFKDATGGRFYHICNCCSCCCVGVRAHNAYHVPLLASSGYTARMDLDECNGCGACEEACPFNAVAVSGERVAVVDGALCMGCGVCETRCDAGAIRLEVDPGRPAPLDIEALIRERKA